VVTTSGKRLPHLGNSPKTRGATDVAKKVSTNVNLM
jgi:hypothetical protein